MPQPRLNRIGDLEIDQHMGVQRFSWRLQAIGQLVMVIFLAAALAGLFGSGPLSRGRVGESGRLEVEYGRFERRTQEASLTVTLGPLSGGTVDLWIAEPFVAASPLVQVIPEPERVALASGRVVFTLRLSGDRPQVRITTKPEVFGRLHGRLGLVGGPEVSFRQLVYP